MNEPISLTLSLGEAEWIRDVRGWNCPAIRLPGIKLNQARINGLEIPLGHVALQSDRGIVEWKSSDPQPPRITLVLTYSTDEALRDREEALRETAEARSATTRTAELGLRWKKLAIIGPLLAGIISPFLVRLPILPAPPPKPDSCWGIVWKDEAPSHFLNGEKADLLAGTWKVKLFDTNGTPFKVAGAEYEPEMVECKVNGSVVSMRTIFTAKEGSKLWAEGRFASGDTLTLVTWPESGHPQERVVSVNLLKLQRSVGALELVGYRIGCERDGTMLPPSKIQYTKTH